MYTVRITHHPAPGKAAELRKVLEEHSKTSNAEGSPHNVSQPLYASDLTYVNGIRHESLAALEAYGARSGVTLSRAASVPPRPWRGGAPRRTPRCPGSHRATGPTRR